MPFNGVASVVVAHLSVKQVDRVQFPASPQKFCIVSSVVEQGPYKAKVGSSTLSRCTNAALADVVIATD